MKYLIVIYLSCLGLVVFRLIRSRLPLPSDVLLLSLFFYNVPLAFAAYLSDWAALGDYNIFLNVVAGDRSIADSTIGITMIASLAVVAGRSMSYSSNSRFEWSVPVTAKLNSVCACFCVGGLGLVTLGIFLFGVDSFFAGYAVESSSLLSAEGTALTYFGYEVIGICSFIWLFCRLHGGHKNGFFWILLALVCLIAITAIRGKRLELIIALSPYLLLAWSSILSNPLRRVVAILVIVFLVSAVASFRQGEIPSATSLVFNIFSEGFYAGHVTPGVIQAVEEGSLSVEYGLRYVASIAAVAPRFFFPEKDNFIYGSLTDVGQFAPLGASSILAEVYLQGGTIAVALWFLIVGLFSGLLEEPMPARAERRLPLRLLFYIIFVCSFIPHFRDGLIPAIKIPLQLLVVSAVVIGLAVGRVRLVRIGRRRCFSSSIAYRLAPRLNYFNHRKD